MKTVLSISVSALLIINVYAQVTVRDQKSIFSTGQNKASATPGLIHGQSSNLCGGGIFNYSIDTVPGAVNYTWTAPASTSIVEGQGSSTIKLNVRSDFVNGNLSVVANNYSGSRAASVIALSAKPALPSEITGPSTVAAHQTGVVFSVENNRANFNWSIVPLDAVITSGWGTNKITVNWGSTGGYVGVSASNACGISDIRGNAVALNGTSAPVKPPSTINANFDIYPNPAKNNCTVVFNEKKQLHYTLYVTNTNGKTVFIKPGISFVGINMITIDMSSFSAGIYLVNLFDVENGTRNERLTKE